ncbi:MAG TPA: flagellin FliC [Bdellovibrionales bacterium]|nr:flagellin FliC [Pseudobdellovibrionaceae bacterium]HAG91739.1 flagellin FliC [Bdellovibrionales bacterium]|tara:strand:- start:4812 stop:5645 length:834 start_codon:yes stop_codon:yes gene_type:complete
MGMRVSTNIAAINAQRNLSGSQSNIQSSLAKLSSGSRINKAADDAAGLAISENLKGQIRSTRQANRNANDGISMVQVAEGGLNEIGNIITRMRELGIQAASDTIGESERGFIDKEIQQLKDEMQRIASVTKWGTTKLLDGTTPVFDFQVGVFNNDSEDRISFDASQNVATLDALGLAGLDYTSKEGAQEALSSLDDAQLGVNSMRSNLGALQNRLMSTVNNLGVAEENLSAANSRIRDTDVAEASSELTRNNIMLQASTATLAQANQTNAAALKLIG